MRVDHKNCRISERLRGFLTFLIYLGWMMGLEPTTTEATTQCSAS